MWIKEELLIPTGYLLLTHWHCSAGKGETKAEFIHRQELQSPNIKEIAQNFKKTALTSVLQHFIFSKITRNR